jgi:hypothetical protein
MTLLIKLLGGSKLNQRSCGELLAHTAISGLLALVRERQEADRSPEKIAGVLLGPQ